jgi:hypothetical protein
MPKEQKTIEGTADDVSERVKEQATLYAKMVRERMALQADEAIAKPALEQMMHEDKIEKLEVSFDHRGGTCRSEVKRSAPPTDGTVSCKKLDD